METPVTDRRSSTGAKPYLDRTDYEQAVERARAAAVAYYEHGALVMDDVTYDELTARIAATEAAQPGWAPSGLDQVAGGVSVGGDVTHSSPMLSLDKAHHPGDVTAFCNRVNGLCGEAVPVVVEPKLDGVALSARYVDGRLTQVVTRGDGTTGEDVTSQVTAGEVAGLPTLLGVAHTFEVRGECYLTAEQFTEANRLRVTAEGKAAFVNRRNAVAGSVRAQQRSYIVPLSFAAYTLVDAAATAPVDHAAQMAWLAELGFTPASALVAALDATPTTDEGEVLARIEALGAARAGLRFEIDGAVVKADRAAQRVTAGATGAHPRWAIAYKYPAEERATRVIAIDVTPGRTGALVPRAELDPVFVGGTTVSYATLHNFEVLAALDVRVGDTVLVKRAGDVIPRVEGVLHDLRPEGTEPFVPPVVCPRCGADIDRSEKRWRCGRGRLCGAVELLAYAAGRDALDIEGLGSTLLERLVDGGHVADLADLFALDAAALAGVERVGETSGAKLLANIEAAKRQPLSRLVTALGLRMTGRRISRRLARHFGTLDALRAASEAQLAEVDGVGEGRAAVIRAELDDVAELCDRLVDAGVRTDEDTESSDGGPGLPWVGKIVVVSGSVPGMSRTEAQEAAERLGAKVSGSVSAKTTLLVAGSGAGSKLAKAESLGVEVMDAAAFAEVVAAHRGL